MSQREALDSFAGFVDRAGIRSTKTGRASETPCRKSLTINLQILHLPPKSSGNVRFCAFTAPTYPEPIRGNPDLRAGTCASSLAGVENPNSNTGLGARCNAHQRPPKSLHRVAACCTVLHRVSPKNLFTPQAQHLHFPGRAGQVHGWYCGGAPGTSSEKSGNSYNFRVTLSFISH